MDGWLVLHVSQVAAQQPSYSIHFFQLTGPELELQAAATAGDPSTTQQQQQAEPSTADAPGTDFLQVLRSIPNCANITYDAFVAGGQCRTQWLAFRTQNSKGCCRNV
jgi:hypothetical protein